MAEAPSSVKWISPKFFKKSLATAIKKDNGIIMSMLGQCGEWKPAEDEKLKSLWKLVAKKHKDEKVLVFTQYSDTARYLAAQLKDLGVTNVAQVDGDSENVVQEVNKFSPVSNKMPPISAEQKNTHHWKSCPLL